MLVVEDDLKVLFTLELRPGLRVVFVSGNEMPATADFAVPLAGVA
jgi:hypothetical protein